MATYAARSAAPASSRTRSSVRVLVVDDSAVIRGFIKRIIAQDPAIEIVGSAANGKIAVDRVAREDVDVVVLDIEMPVMDGLEALPLILKARPGVQVIMASTLTRRGASVSIRALSLGAADFVPKPAAARDVRTSEEFGSELIRKIKALGGHDGRATPKSTRPAAPATTAPLRSEKAAWSLRQPAAVRPRIVAIGSSTGGPQALVTVLRDVSLPAAVPIVVTQHMPATFTAILAENLARETGRPCVEGASGMVVEGGHIYVAPGDYHMTLVNADAAVSLHLDQSPAVNFCRPAVDPLFRSVADCYGSAALAVVLTGMGHDGAAGAQQIVDAGGAVVAQDEASSVVWGMPGAVATAGLCSAVLPLDKIASHITAKFRE